MKIYTHLEPFFVISSCASAAVLQMMVKMSTFSCGDWFVGRYPDGTYPSVQARNNWWGRNHLSFVAGRIWERRDDDNLIRVEYNPFLPDNTSVLHGTKACNDVVIVVVICITLHVMHTGDHFQ